MTKGDAQKLMLRHCISLNDMVQAGAPMVREALVKHLMGKSNLTTELPSGLTVFVARLARERDEQDS